MTSASVEENIFLARVAEQAERFEDMVEYLRPVLKEKGADVTSDERNLLSVAFKNLITSKRNAWRTITAIEQNPKYTKFADQLQAYKKKIEDGLFKDCDTVISMIRQNALNNGRKSGDEPRAFFVKMVGDYYRYIAESATGDRFEAVK
jgi:14-3-3 protein epsilon